MTTLQEHYIFTASIKARGENRQGSGWTLTPNWKLPSSLFELVLYGKDWGDIEGWAVGDMGTFTVNRGNLRANREGKYNTDYYWDLVSIERPDSTSPAEEPPSSDEPKPQATRTVPDIPPNPAALGACQNHAVDFIVAGMIPVPEGRELTSFIWEIRDRFYRNINQKTLAPLHFCYSHGAERIQSPRTHIWGHVLPDKTACVEPPDAAAGLAGAGAEAE